MRKGEILSLRWENVNLERNFITVTAVQAKSKRIRRIPINSELRELFVKLKLTQNYFYTYHLFLEGQIPSIDNDPDQLSNFPGTVDQFKKEALTGNLPAFSYLEPVWIAPTGTTSYHPTQDLVPGEVALNEIYNTLRKGPNWDQTLLSVTFDKNGGIYDHVPPPGARNPWPNDLFNFIGSGLCAHHD